MSFYQKDYLVFSNGKPQIQSTFETANVNAFAWGGLTSPECGTKMVRNLQINFLKNTRFSDYSFTN